MSMSRPSVPCFSLARALTFRFYDHPPSPPSTLTFLVYIYLACNFFFLARFYLQLYFFLPFHPSFLWRICLHVYQYSHQLIVTILLFFSRISLPSPVLPLPFSSSYTLCSHISQILPNTPRSPLVCSSHPCALVHYRTCSSRERGAGYIIPAR